MAELIRGMPPEYFWRYVTYQQLTAVVRCYEKLLVESRYPGARIRREHVQVLRTHTGELELSLRGLREWMPAGEARDHVTSLIDDAHQLVHQLDYLPFEFKLGGHKKAEGTLKRIAYHTKYMRIGLRSRCFAEPRNYIRLMSAFDRLPGNR